ncbi:DUF389 domain-containing protein [Pontibacter sp. JH31]|uniref:DUF389 domain-containing protein n=1 Tax=Pontibacter aquaedesilientis TaxID=2766980 RepID=A0ABR7XH34_9BACT|nr:DUF389 domain-containing protein [Pontibacter aquaedesilientis]MBD1397600.1 DUF389 domain-containing protein [Pontibacter aquaedesilientis]
MDRITLIYDNREERTVKEKIVPALGDALHRLLPFKHNDVISHELEHECCVVTYLSDEGLAEVVAVALQKKWTLGFLPHPDMKEARQGYGVSDELPEAIGDILNSEGGTPADLLLCNGKPVFNSVVIGNSLSIMSGSVAQNPLLSRWEKLKNLFSHPELLKPRLYTIRSGDKPPIKTGALGIIAVLHGKSTLVSRILLKDSFINDGRLHVLVLAPRSIMELIKFSVTSTLERSEKQSLPGFIGHIKNKSVLISSPDAMDYSQDSRLMSAKEIELSVCEDSLLIIPGRHLALAQKQGDAAEKFRVDKLPKGDSFLQEFTAAPLPWVYHASTDEFKGLFTVLRENARASSPYLTLMVLSTMLATFGLFSNSSPVIIGAMILAPLMAPIISLSMGVLRQDRSITLKSLKTIAYGLLLGYIAALILTWLTPLQNMNDEISARIRPNLLDLGVAIVSGIAGAYAHARAEVAKTLAGVAIAVALVPPLAVSGMGLGWGDSDVFIGALLLLMTNLAGIVLAGSFTFMLLGFSPLHLAKKGLMLSLLVVVLVSLPLGYGSISMIRDHKIIRTLSNHKVDDITLRQVSVIRGGDTITLGVTLVSANPIDNKDLEKVKASIASKIGSKVELEALIMIRK